MPEAADLRKQAAATRNMADRARRLARDVGPSAERERLLQYVKELEEQAQRLEAQASSHISDQAHTVEQTQQQAQQQGPSDADIPPERKT